MALSLALPRRELLADGLLPLLAQTESGLFINVGFDAWGGMLAAVRRLVSYFLQPKWLGGVPRQYTRVSSLGGRKEIDELQSLLASGES